ncbi:MAG: AsnC family transcriptional regulator [Cryobacterium sp.]|uniref:Lrp/AsnC family transcriptional regulator n=1 Tax=unclassified Cryobacterium TaxID=2649013 RepID=UPI0018CAFEC6|nr:MULTISPECIES: AsnC family transcriptional regulator [unclassified Cryobacterium]MCY7403091.1 AsnC family transcriptional regulator [Cryobacterium sp.]MEC5152777.1 DNA-binding Lrp family transcriptional regulator [Cryobacterium sp. CAN_C3]
MRLLDPLERRIAAALQFDGRSPWSRIADVLGEPERTVARRGSELLEAKLVQVAALRPQSTSVIIRVQTTPGTTRATANALAQRRDSTFAYTMTGGVDCVVEVLTEAERMPALLTDEIPGTVGLVRAVSYPILRYFRTIRGWQPDLLTEVEADALRVGVTMDTWSLQVPQRLSRVDNEIVEALCQDGRVSCERLARLTGVSNATARRRTDWLLQNDHVYIRAVVEPASVGLPVEAFLWIRCDPKNVEAVGRELAASPLVRYAVAVAGDYQIVANVTARDQAALYGCVTAAPWVAHTKSIDVSMLLEAFKRGGRMLQLPRT